MDKEQKLDFCLDWIKRIHDQYDAINTNRVDALRFYRNSEDIVKVIDGRSQAVTTDMQDTIEWIKPSLLEIFTGGDQVTSLEPTGEEDVEAVKNQELLVNMQMRNKNPWFTIMHDVMDDALKLKWGGVKYQWFKDVQYIKKSYEGLTEQEYQAKIGDKNVEVMSTEPTIIQEGSFDPISMQPIPPVMEYNLTLRYKIEDEYPLIEPVPADDLKYPIDTRDIKTAPFVYHICRYDKHSFIKKYGRKIFDKVEEIKDTYKNNEDTSVYEERFNDVGGVSFIWDDTTSKWLVYECYFWDTDKEVLPWIFKFCGDQVLTDEENEYGCPCFEGFTPVKMAHRILGMSIYDLIWQIQKIRTGILRQILDNIWKSNFRRYFGDKNRVDMDAFLNNNVANAFIPTTGDVRTAVQAEDKAPLPPEVFGFWETMLTERDYHTGVPRSFQGVNPKMLNETFRGQAQQVNQAGQRIQLIARIIAEMFVVPLVTDIVNLNIKFLKKKTSVRYLNKWIEINPDNIVAKPDVTVNVGLGTGDKQVVIGQIQQILGLFGQVQKAGVPVVTAQNVYHAMKELVKAMGFKDTANWVTDPKMVQAVQQLLSMITSQMQQAMAQMAPPPMPGMPPQPPPPMSPQMSQMMQLVQQIGAMLGGSPQGQEGVSQGGAGPGGAAPFPGQNIPHLAPPPAQANNPPNPVGGGPYYG